MTIMSSQSRLFRFDGDVAAAKRPYVPILLVKRGERQALEKLEGNARALLTPWLRVVSPESENESDGTARREMGRIARVSTEQAVYLDAVGAQRRGRARARLGNAYVQRVYETAVGADLAFLPVYPFGRPDLAKTVADFQSPELGAAVLVTHDTALLMGTNSFDGELRNQVRSLAVEPARLDVMVDLGYIPPESTDSASVVWLLGKVVGAVPWRTVIVAGTSVPESFAGDIRDDSVGWIERRERALFDAVQRELGTSLRFADYAVQNPHPPGRGFARTMRANIRYTSGGSIYVSRGGRPMGEIPRDEWPMEYRRVASRLISEAPFAESGCCWGDEFVASLADGQREAKSQHWMRAAATCHHLTIVAREQAARASERNKQPTTRNVAVAAAPRRKSPLSARRSS